MMLKSHCLGWLLVACSLAACGGGSGSGSRDSVPDVSEGGPMSYDGMTLVWADEFDGDSLDLSRWSYDTGNGCPSLCGWGNNELQLYTDSTDNLSLANGHLVITAKPEASMASRYSSAKIVTQGKQAFQYGRIDVRAKLPYGQGLWPAIWMLPEDNVYGGWPSSGEIDIVELVGDEPERIHGTVHFGPAVGYSENSGRSYRLASGDFSDDFHLFSIVWEENSIRWYVDGIQYHAITSASVGSNIYPFNEAFHLIINVAVGGNWPGEPDSSTVFPQTMLVDYVRYFQ